jgi:hypothetical protein
MLIKFSEIVNKYGQPKGIIHIGAHLMEERNDYLSFGFKNTIWVEANPKIYSNIKFINNENKLISQINEPFTYWLDGHYSGGKTGFGFLEFPIMIELESILKRNINDEIIYIDDMRILENYSKTINKNLIIELVNKYKNNFNISYERSEFYKEDIMIIEY